MKSEFFAEKTHKWLSLIIGVQAIIWLVSGLYMVIVNIEFIHGDQLVRPIERFLPAPSEITVTLDDLKSEYDNIRSLSLKSLAGNPYYEISTPDGLFLVQAQTGEKLTLVPQSIIRQQAEDIYAGEGTISNIQYLTEGPVEMQNRKVALWRVDFKDTIDTSFYFSPTTGELISKRHFYWRAFDLLWMLHIMDYETRTDITTTLFRVATILGLIAFMSGLWYTWFRFTKSSKKLDIALTEGSKQGAMPLLRTIHKWIGLIVGLQIIIWTLSALIMSYIGRADGGHYSKGLPSGEISQEATLLTPQELMNRIEGPKLDHLKLTYLLDQYVYEVSGKNDIFLFKATTGTPLTISSSLARQIAEFDYVGTTPANEPVYFETTPYAARSHNGPVWQVHFSDPENPTYYIAADNGKIIERRDDHWESFDFWWMLHMMDFSKEGNFNNAIVIAFALVSLFIGLTGFILLFDSFNRNSFNFKVKWANYRAKPIAVSLQKDDESNAISTLYMKPGTPLFEGLANAGYDLPSNCGGKGDCGLCRVEFIEGAAEPTENERKRVPKRRLANGARLACQNTVSHPIFIKIK
jgi:ferredoxin